MFKWQRIKQNKWNNHVLYNFWGIIDIHFTFTYVANLQYVVTIAILENYVRAIKTLNNLLYLLLFLPYTGVLHVFM